MFFSRTALLRQDAINWLETLLGGAKIPPSTIRALGRLYFGEEIHIIAKSIPDEEVLAFYKAVAKGVGNLLPAFKSKLLSRVKSSVGFTLVHTDAQLIQIINKGKELGLDPSQFESFPHFKVAVMRAALKSA